MDEETLNKLKKAGQIAAEARDFGISLIKKGSSLLDVTKQVEDKVIKLGGNMAFPPQISLNDCAAHFYPDADDKTIFEDQVCSLDVGVHIDGYIGGDTARTVDLSGENAELVKASLEALNNALKIVKPGIKISEIGKVIQETISGYGFAPVRNLSGHGLDQFNIHTKPSIPNYDNGDNTELQEDQLIAIEPFASKGAGIIYESGNATVFQLIGKKPVRNIFTRQILKELEKYNGLPFCRRWLTEKFSLPKVNFALRELKNLEILREYPPLVDRNHGLISQAEHTLIVKDKLIILTKKE
ncbi:type II methionyl aminopeptidase [Candidatus Woesearchaeota archaeon]|nr:type II methionyl aminopeptidase [Candidatus Woesearchaeota archaeon]